MGANSGQIIKLFFILSTMCCIYFFNFYFQIKYIVFFVLIIYWLYLKCHTWHLAVLILSFFWKLWSCMSLWKCIMYNVPKLNGINKYLSFFLLIWIHFLMSPCDFLSDNGIYTTYVTRHLLLFWWKTDESLFII